MFLSVVEHLTFKEPAYPAFASRRDAIGTTMERLANNLPEDINQSNRETIEVELKPY